MLGANVNQKVIDDYYKWSLKMNKLNEFQLQTYGELQTQLNGICEDIHKVKTKKALNSLVEKYNFAVDDIETFCDDIVGDMQNYYNEQSESWQGSPEGEEYQKAIDSWEGVTIATLEAIDRETDIDEWREQENWSTFEDFVESSLPTEFFKEEEEEEGEEKEEEVKEIPLDDELSEDLKKRLGTIQLGNLQEEIQELEEEISDARKGKKRDRIIQEINAKVYEYNRELCTLLNLVVEVCEDRRKVYKSDELNFEFGEW